MGRIAVLVRGEHDDGLAWLIGGVPEQVEGLVDDRVAVLLAVTVSEAVAVAVLAQGAPSCLGTQDDDVLGGEAGCGQDRSSVSDTHDVNLRVRVPGPLPDGHSMVLVEVNCKTKCRRLAKIGIFCLNT